MEFCWDDRLRMTDLGHISDPSCLIAQSGQTDNSRKSPGGSNVQSIQFATGGLLSKDMIKLMKILSCFFTELKCVLLSQLAGVAALLYFTPGLYSAAFCCKEEWELWSVWILKIIWAHWKVSLNTEVDILCPLYHCTWINNTHPTGRAF